MHLFSSDDVLSDSQLEALAHALTQMMPDLRGALMNLGALAPSQVHRLLDLHDRNGQRLMAKVMSAYDDDSAYDRLDVARFLLAHGALADGQGGSYADHPLAAFLLRWPRTYANFLSSNLFSSGSKVEDRDARLFDVVAEMIQQGAMVDFSPPLIDPGTQSLVPFLTSVLRAPSGLVEGMLFGWGACRSDAIDPSFGSAVEAFLASFCTAGRSDRMTKTAFETSGLTTWMGEHLSTNHLALVVRWALLHAPVFSQPHSPTVAFGAVAMDGLGGHDSTVAWAKHQGWTWEDVDAQGWTVLDHWINSFHVSMKPFADVNDIMVWTCAPATLLTVATQAPGLFLQPGPGQHRTRLATILELLYPMHGCFEASADGLHWQIGQQSVSSFGQRLEACVEQGLLRQHVVDTPALERSVVGRKM